MAGRIGMMRGTLCATLLAACGPLGTARAIEPLDIGGWIEAGHGGAGGPVVLEAGEMDRVAAGAPAAPTGPGGAISTPPIPQAGIGFGDGIAGRRLPAGALSPAFLRHLAIIAGAVELPAVALALRAHEATHVPQQRAGRD